MEGKPRSWLAVVALAAGLVSVGWWAAPGVAGLAGEPSPAPEETPVQLDFHRVEIGRVFDTVAKATGLELDVRGIDKTEVVSFKSDKRPLREVLDELGKAHGFDWKIEDGKTLVLRPAESPSAAAR